MAARLDPDDETLLVRWRSGDASAAAQLVRRHTDALLRFFRGRYDDGVPDLVQRTFLGAVQARDRVPSGLPFRAYLMGIAHRQLLMAWRGDARARRVFAPQPATGVAPGSTPTQAIARRQAQKLLLRALRRLPVDLQSLIQLHYWDDLALEVIGLAIGIPEGTVKSRLHRARRLLRELIVELAEAPELAESTLQGLDDWAAAMRELLGPEHA